MANPANSRRTVQETPALAMVELVISSKIAQTTKSLLNLRARKEDPVVWWKMFWRLFSLSLCCVDAVLFYIIFWSTIFLSVSRFWGTTFYQWLNSQSILQWTRKRYRHKSLACYSFKVSVWVTARWWLFICYASWDLRVMCGITWSPLQNHLTLQPNL